jgi:hypothetical protein
MIRGRFLRAVAFRVRAGLRPALKAFSSIKLGGRRSVPALLTLVDGAVQGDGAFPGSHLLMGEQ